MNVRVVVYLLVTAACAYVGAAVGSFLLVGHMLGADDDRADEGL